ncbi:hypothetical protein NQ318_003520 [Aromia moschata]|uniref:Peptidase S1 domain-containing protein n=1 Tax=Aromia moschata TaxID=1265417 RepID=A0AAV8YV72_9CUCU|nr:hypothetical protein NQ318_003520 [Aromia moschata]
MGSKGEWCWQVALINSLNQYLCGAALIGTQWVLTAAHCVTNIVRSGDAIYVRVGDHDLTRKYGSPGAQTLRVATTYIHHNHNSQTLDNDIALLKLHRQAELKEGVCLVCLPARGASHAAGKRCTVTGYGYMGEAITFSRSDPTKSAKAEIPIVSDAECIRKVNAVTEKIFIPSGQEMVVVHWSVKTTDSTNWPASFHGASGCGRPRRTRCLRQSVAIYWLD